jgi:hypothetical protein
MRPIFLGTIMRDDRRPRRAHHRREDPPTAASRVEPLILWLPRRHDEPAFGRLAAIRPATADGVPGRDSGVEPRVMQEQPQFDHALTI